MTSEWKNYKIKDVLSYVVDNRGKTPPIQDEGFELLEVNAISATEKFPQYQLVRKHVSEHVYNTWFRSGHPQIGDILVPTVGTLGAVSYVNKDNCCIAQNLIALRANKNICDCDYLYYILRNPNTRKRLLNLNIGGVQPSIKVPHLMDLEIEIPPVEIQKKIVSILKVLDDKISINQKTNDNLQQQLFSLYDNIAVTSSCVSEATLSELCDFQEGYVNPAQTHPEYFDGEIKWLRAVDINESFITETSRTLTRVGFESAKKSALLFKPNTIAISKSGTIGRLGIIADYMCGNRAVINIAPRDTNMLAFIYCFLKSKQREFPDMAVGSVQKNLYVSLLEPLSVSMPDDESLTSFNVAGASILDMILNNCVENKNLANLRDTLLPKLMSGEIDVSDIQL